MTNVHNDGFLLVEEVLGSELAVVNAARISYDKRKPSIDAADVGLINSLMRDRHGSPFEQAGMRFHVRCPIFVAREWFRHRIGSFSEVSGRYVEMKNVAYVPASTHVRSQVGKAMRYEFVSSSSVEETQELINQAYLSAFRSYNEMLSLGIAKELARVVLPLGLYTEFHWSVNLRSLMNFLSLRTHETAQQEIRDYANVVLERFAVEFPNVHSAWVSNGKVGP
jgi:thymidylate synthase (FAD)